MQTMLTLILITMQGEADLALGRFAEHIRKADSLAVSLRISATGTSLTPSGTLVIQRPDKLLFTLKGGPYDYVWSSSAKGIVEIERAEKTYHEIDAQGRLVLPRSVISSAPQTGFPMALLMGDLRGLIPQGERYKLLGKVTIGGETTDHLKSSFTTVMGPASVDVFIAPDGRLLRFIDTRGDGGSEFKRTLELSNYKVNQPVAANTFDVTVPSGYVPHELPPVPYPTQVGSKPRLTGWTRNGKAVDLRAEAAGKPSLLILTHPDCAPSKRSAQTLEALSSAAQKAGIRTFWLSTATSGKGIVDGTGRAASELGLPGTPLVYLLGADGVVLRLWYGFDPTDTRLLTNSFAEALKEL